MFQIQDQEGVYHEEAMYNSYHMVGFGRETNSNGQDKYVISVRDLDKRYILAGKQTKSMTALAYYGEKISQLDLTYQIYKKHFVRYQEYRNKNRNKPANSE